MVLRWRILASSALPSAVVETRTTRRSAASGWRRTSPAASSFVTTLVTLGGATRSYSASAPRVTGPSCSMALSAESWLGERPASACWRSCRASRVALSRNRAAIAAASVRDVAVGMPKVYQANH